MVISPDQASDGVLRPGLFGRRSNTEKMAGNSLQPVTLVLVHDPPLQTAVDRQGILAKLSCSTSKKIPTVPHLHRGIATKSARVALTPRLHRLGVGLPRLRLRSEVHPSLRAHHPLMLCQFQPPPPPPANVTPQAAPPDQGSDIFQGENG